MFSDWLVGWLGKYQWWSLKSHNFLGFVTDENLFIFQDSTFLHRYLPNFRVAGILSENFFVLQDSMNKDMLEATKTRPYLAKI